MRNPLIPGLAAIALKDWDHLAHRDAAMCRPDVTGRPSRSARRWTKLTLILTGSMALIGSVFATDTGAIDVGSATTTTASGTLTGGPTSFTGPASPFGIYVLGNKSNGSGIQTWAVTASYTPDVSPAGPETSVAIAMTSASGFTAYSASEPNGANVTLSTAGSSGAKEIVAGTIIHNASELEIVTTSLTVAVPATATPGTYTGILTLTLSDSSGGFTPLSAMFSYTYTVTASSALVSVSPASIGASSFTENAGGTTFTAPTGTVAASITAVTATASSWTLSAYVSAHTGPETAVSMNTTSISQSVYPSTTVSGGSIQIAGASPGTQIATGTTATANQAGPTEILTTGLVLTVPATSTPATYTGTVTLTLKYGSNTTTATIGYTYTIPNYLNISFDQGLDFVIATPGLATGPTSGTGFPNPYATITATSNVVFHFTASIAALTSGANTIPTSGLWLVMDSNASNLSSDGTTAVTNNPSGLASIRYPTSGTIALGSSLPFYLSGQVKTSINTAPGLYSGSVIITIVAN